MRKRNSKASIRKQLLAQERQRMEIKADKMATIVSALEAIEDQTVTIGHAISELQEMDVTLTDIELATDISAIKLGKLRREATLIESDDVSDDDVSDDDVSDDDVSDDELPSAGDINEALRGGTEDNPETGKIVSSEDLDSTSDELGKTDSEKDSEF